MEPTLGGENWEQLNKIADTVCGTASSLKEDASCGLGVWDEPGSFSSLRYLKPDWHQLIIIGNGFDQACDLKSGFSDFFSPRLERIREIERRGFDDGKSIGVQLKEAGLTAWDIILLNRDGDNWSDVESAISTWVHPSRVRALHHLDLQNSILEDEFVGRQWQRSLLPRNSTGYKLHRYLIEIGILSSDDYSRAKLNKVMLSDLHRLEHEFGSYLSGQITNSEFYARNARRLLEVLVESEAGSEEDYRLKTSVLSFNYTGLKEMGHLLDFKIANYVNVHGKLGGDIIFGIDGGGQMSNDNVIPFTKTYRLMGLGGPGHHEVLSGDIDLIKFFGHSLADADYSYFQAIFDTVELYNGNTRLVFYYFPYLNKTKLEARTEMMNRVTRLLTIYGETLDNKDHGKNLIHKLLLEGRLAVELLPCEEQLTDAE